MRVWLATTVLLALLAAGAALPRLGDRAPGAAVFRARCAQCHGESGYTDTALGRTLKAAPLVHDRRLAHMTTAEIIAAVRADPKHHGLVDMSDADLKAAALFVKRLARRSER